jgi:hypothetical protein
MASFVARDTIFQYNELSFTPYTAITIGWGWHTVVGNNSYMQGQRVLANRLHDIVLGLFDGGAVYTLGNQPGSVLAGNHIARQHDFLAALYHDDGSGGWHDYDNVIELLGHGKGRGSGECAKCMPWVSMWTAYCHDINVTSNFVDCNCINNAGTRTSVSNTTTVTKGGKWPAKAQQVIHDAGPRYSRRFMMQGHGIAGDS